MKKFIAIFAAALCLAACCREAQTYTVMISLDAFRWDYPDIFDTPNLDRIASEGVRAAMLPSYPSSTFPNHYTIATGLVPDHNGIVNSSFWDENTGKQYGMGDKETRNDPSYYNGETIWCAAERQGVRTASIYWVGSDIPIGGRLPSIYRYWYDEPRLTYEERAHEAVRLLSLPEGERPRLTTVYFDDPDMTSHEFGPKSAEAGVMVHYLDSLVGIIYDGCRALPYGDRINVIVTADHGMTDISDERFVRISDYVKSEWCEHIVSTNPTSIFPKEGCRDLILDALKDVEHISVWTKDAVPKHLNYGSSPRIGQIVVAPDLGWQFAQQPRGILGAHGYDPEESDMQVNFCAAGPDFRQGYVCESKFINIDIYPMLCKVLGIECGPVDGKLERIQQILR